MKHTPSSNTIYAFLCSCREEGHTLSETDKYNIGTRRPCGPWTLDETVCSQYWRRMQKKRVPASQPWSTREYSTSPYGRAALVHLQNAQFSLRTRLIY